MQQQPLRRARSYEQDDAAGTQIGGIAERISAAISVGMISVGERLPSEAELANQFGIAVATLRKALAKLRELGIVETRRGRNGGTFVVQAPFPSADALKASLRGTSLVALRDFFDEHAAISGMAARLAAERISPQQQTRLAEFAFQAREARGARETATADNRFHFEIAVLSHSQRLLTGEQRLQSELTPFLWQSEICRASAQLVFTEHLAIVMAIEQRNAEEAQSRAIAHVMNNRRLVIEGKLALDRASADAEGTP
ncbi:FadR family transcriptional regulator [Leucobacter weissii]|uniref:FadR family transcriptional regulator n=1 Tax=Leucobacter weissii TaxID=1983706 RepID=A0A939MSE9_9MICO|nr:GntR family transcriptional regulator [Leucobacter weissii]MBO1902149.1 FadR family transcriptional regulator [Leucobacter weissii]